jgi:hypothetical protein
VRFNRRGDNYIDNFRTMKTIKQWRLTSFIPLLIISIVVTACATASPTELMSTQSSGNINDYMEYSQGIGIYPSYDECMKALTLKQKIAEQANEKTTYSCKDIAYRNECLRKYGAGGC